MSWLVIGHTGPEDHLPHTASQAIAESIGCSQQPDGKNLLLKAILTYIIKRGEAKLNWKLHPY